jgi:hypothetical protein
MTTERDIKRGAIDGPNGRFEVACVDERADSEYCFLYQDEKSRFYFNAELVRQPTLSFKVTRASMSEWFGAPFSAFGAREEVLRRNIELFFKTRDWLHPWKPGNEASAAMATTFEWNIAQIDGRTIKVTQIDGPNGPFEIAAVRLLREEGTRYFYQDQRGRFFFLAIRGSKPESNWEIHSEPPFRTSRENEAFFRQNIEYFFKTRTAATSILFPWKISDPIPVAKAREFKSTRIQGPSGPFDIAFAGSNSHGLHCYYYQDERNSFWFMALFSSEPAPTWDVARATISPWGLVGNYKMSPENEVILRQNILLFFNTRQWQCPSGPMSGGMETPVRFSWRVVP